MQGISPKQSGYPKNTVNQPLPGTEITADKIEIDSTQSTHQELYTKIRNNINLYIYHSDRGNEKAFNKLVWLCNYSQKQSQAQDVNHSTGYNDAYSEHCSLFNNITKLSEYNSPTASYLCSTFYNQGVVTQKDKETEIAYLCKTYRLSNFPNHAALKATGLLATHFSSVQVSSHAEYYATAEAKLKSQLTMPAKV